MTDTFDNRLTRVPVYVSSPDDPPATMEPEVPRLSWRERAGNALLSVLDQFGVAGLPEGRQREAAREGRNKLLHIGPMEEQDYLWPERMARSAVTLAGDMRTGNVPPPGLRREDYTDIPADPSKVGGTPHDDLIQRVQDMAGLAMTGGWAGTGSGGKVLGSGATMPSHQPISVARHFKDVAYPHAKMERGDWARFNRAVENGDHVEVDLPLRSLNATQKTVNPDFMSVRNDELPAVMKKGGEYYVQDGHHRLMREAASGKQTARVRLYDVDPSTKDPRQLTLLSGNNAAAPIAALEHLTTGQLDDAARAVAGRKYEQLDRNQQQRAQELALETVYAKNDAAAPVSALERAPVWYSPVEHALEQSTQGSATGGLAGTGGQAGASLGSGGILRPAWRIGEGRFIKGKPGQDHVEIIPEKIKQRAAEEGSFPEDFLGDRGFINHKGQFLDSEQAMEYAREYGLLNQDYTGEHALITDMLSAKNEAAAPLSALEAESLFRQKLKNDFYHEAPGDVADSMRRKGIEGDYGIFATVGQPSGFVTSPRKTIVRFSVPENQLRHIYHDMRYEDFAQLVREHPEIKGADVTFPENIPPSWIRDIQVLNAKNEAAAPLAALEKRGPVWYSPVEHALEQSTQGSATGAQWLATIRNSRGVKPEELDWTGLRQFLEERADKPVTRPELHEYLRDNRVELQDVTRGGEGLPRNWDELTKQQKEDIRFAYRDYSGGGLQDQEKYVRQWYEQLDPGDRATVLPSMDSTKYHDYQLPGGENYREHLITMPSQARGPRTFKQWLEAENEYRLTQDEPALADGPEARRSYSRYNDKNPTPDFKSSHWDEPNIVAHVRSNVREMLEPGGFVLRNRNSGNTTRAFKTEQEAADHLLTLPEKLHGSLDIVPSDKPIEKRSLHLEEVQSDWHQAGRRKGYMTGERPATQEDIEAGRAQTNRQGEPTVGGHGVPDAPWKKTWHELALRRMIRLAAEEGMDRISWTPGEAQAARYDLSKQIDTIELRRSSQDAERGLLIAKGKQGQSVLDKKVDLKELPDLIGKEAADKLLKQEYNQTHASGTGHQKLENADLKVGGEGMRGFYDKMMVQAVEKLGREYGVKVRQGSLPGKEVTKTVDDRYSVTGDKKIYDTRAEAEKAAAQPIWYFDIPPAMREAALGRGMPLFSGGKMFVPSGVKRAEEGEK